MDRSDLEVGDIVMCTVEKIAGTVVFVKIDENGQGSIILSEIAPGRIRNLRDYVVPKKKIICKVLRISGDRVDLSLRRVTPKEQKELREKYKFEKSYRSVLQSILGNKASEIIKEIQKEKKVYDFLEEAKENPKNLEKLVGKKDATKILGIINAQKQKTYLIKKQISLTTDSPNGLELIKKILGNIQDVEVQYISAGRYSLKTESNDPKKADNKLKETLNAIEDHAKNKGFDFSIKEK